MAFYTYKVAVCPSPFPACVYTLDSLDTTVSLIRSSWNQIQYSYFVGLCVKLMLEEDSLDFQPRDFWNCLFADLALGSE